MLICFFVLVINLFITFIHLLIVIIKISKILYIMYVLLDEMRILLVGAGDLRHVLTTLARSYRYRKKKIHVSLCNIKH